MRGGLIPLHFQIGMKVEEGVRIREVLEELRAQEKNPGPYRLNLNEAEDEAVEALAKALATPKS